jgi:hypothetical protein
MTENFKTWIAVARDFYERIDTELIQSYKVGLVLGVVLLTTLILFPGNGESALENQPEIGIRENAEGSGIMENAEESHPQDQETGAGWTPHQKMNFVVYVILISVALLVLNCEYGGVFSKLARIYFPREASALGLL